MVFGGDFRQTLPVVPKGTHQQVVAASLCRGNLWGHIKFLHLRQNMHLGHSEADNQHAQWLLEIGASRAQDDQYFLDRIILCPRNDQVHDINEAITNGYLLDL